ncbi:MAG: histidinol dehydrogenase [Woeseiaceae bacterium]|nr:histidinol dehydrogenase [Woeseiaceae bacterium]
MNIQFVEWASAGEEQREALIQRPAMASDQDTRRKVQSIIDDVVRRGDAAVLEYTDRFDGVRLDSLRVDKEEVAWAEAQLSAESVKAIDVAISNVRRFHEAQRPVEVDVETMPGVRCRRISQPLDSVGLYVPAGTAPLPSAAVMLAVPAAIAACPTRILCTPPRPDGKADPAVIVAATRAGVTEIFKAGGAQAIAAMAYGTATIPKALKLFGPGNAWVTAAKSIVSGDANGAAIDMPAGPSEVLVIADDNANPEYVASDLLSQAEHGADSQVVLLTTSSAFATRVESELESQLKELSRSDIASAALGHSRLIVVDGLDTAVDVSNRYAPEHLIIQVDDASSMLPGIRNAGSVFVGPWTPESVGDYCSGTNHVLPTYGFARNYSGLGLDQFMRQMTIQELSREGLEALAPSILELASLEGLDAHAAAVSRRLRS